METESYLWHDHVSFQYAAGAAILCLLHWMAVVSHHTLYCLPFYTRIVALCHSKYGVWSWSMFTRLCIWSIKIYCHFMIIKPFLPIVNLERDIRLTKKFFCPLFIYGNTLSFSHHFSAVLIPGVVSCFQHWSHILKVKTGDVQIALIYWKGWPVLTRFPKVHYAAW